jgi:hypothetical protein
MNHHSLTSPNGNCCGPPSWWPSSPLASKPWRGTSPIRWACCPMHGVIGQFGQRHVWFDHGHSGCNNLLTKSIPMGTTRPSIFHQALKAFSSWWLRWASFGRLPTASLTPSLARSGLGLGAVGGQLRVEWFLAWVMLGAAKGTDPWPWRPMPSIWSPMCGRLLAWSSVCNVYFTGWLWLDAVVAIAVALNILKEGVHLIWRSSQGLMDEAVEPECMAAHPRRT